MSSEQFCLRWNNHHPNLIQVFSSLLQNDQMVDVTLISDDREIHAHKIVLSACSPFFQNIFLKNSCKHPVIVLTDIKFDHLKNLIDFIYNGKVNIFEEHLPELLRIANVLKIKGLVSEIPIMDTSSDTDDLDGSQQQQHNAEQTHENFTLSRRTIDDEPQMNETNVEQAKLTKKRKSVSFLETPEIVHSEFGAMPDIEYCSNRKRNLRSSTEVCTITKLNQSIDNEREIQTIKTELIDVNESNIFSSTIESNSSNSLPKKPRNTTSRKMIRKNENFLRALEAVRTQGIGFCKAAKIHGVNNRTLWLEYQKLGYPMKNARQKKSNS